MCSLIAVQTRCLAILFRPRYIWNAKPIISVLSTVLNHVFASRTANCFPRFFHFSAFSREWRTEATLVAVCLHPFHPSICRFGAQPLSCVTHTIVVIYHIYTFQEILAAALWTIFIHVIFVNKTTSHHSLSPAVVFCIFPRASYVWLAVATIWAVLFHKRLVSCAPTKRYCLVAISR